VAYHPDGNSIAVGLGGRVNGKGRNKKDGVFMIFSVAGDYEVVHEGRDTREWVTDVKFSSDGETLALGSRDNNIYLYDVGNGYAARAVFSKHTSFVTHLDFSSDSQWIMSNSGADDLLWCDAATGAHLASGARVRDQTWETWTCPLGWHVQGVWKDYEAPDLDVSSIDRTSGSGVSDLMESAGTVGSDVLLIVGDTYGRIRLYRYPSVDKQSPYLEFTGHSTGAIPSLRFSHDDMFVMSVGSQDRCLMQWRHLRDTTMDVADLAGDSGEDSGLDEEGEPSMIPDGAEAYLSSRPWAGAISAPSAAPRPDTRKPIEKIDVEWVYGFRSMNASNNVRYNLRGEVVFHAAGLGVVYDKNRDVQKFHAGYHGGDVLCLAIDPKRRFVATGEEGDRPGINVWDSQTTRLLCRLGGGGEVTATEAGPHCGGGVCSLSFSHDGRRIASVSNDADWTLAVWRTQRGDWTDGTLVAWRPSSRVKVLFVHFTGHAKYFLMTGGLPSDDVGGSVRFWSTKDGEESSLRAHKPMFGVKGKIQPLLCAATSGYRLGDADRVETAGGGGGDQKDDDGKKRPQVVRKRLSIADRLVQNPRGTLVTGTASGHLYCWEGLEMVRPIKGHTRSVTAIHAAHGSGSSACLVTGSKDGTVKLWDGRIQLLKVFDMSEATPGCRSLAVRSVCYDPRRELVLVGMRGSELYEFTRETKACRQLLQGHSGSKECEVWGMAPHPTNPHVLATTGDDETVRIWDTRSHRLLRTAELGGPARAVCWSSDGSMLAMGIGAGRTAKGKSKKNQQSGKVADGVLLVLKADTLDIIHEARDTMEWISDIKFDLQTRWCGVASMDGVLYVYDVEKKFQLTTRCAPSSSYLTHFDFSDDGTRIQAATGSQELLFYDTATGDLIQAPSAMKNIDWSTWTIPIGWPVQGLWPEPSEAVPVALLTSTHRSNNQALIAAADEYGGAFGEVSWFFFVFDLFLIFFCLCSLAYCVLCFVSVLSVFCLCFVSVLLSLFYCLSYYISGVRVVRYPCVDPRSQFINLQAHSMHTTKVRFNADDTSLFSLGGTDRALVQFSITGERTSRSSFATATED
jgi:microtubule-associated protein-like 6